jgi:two-component system nitrate/nitrite response regulator NarL
MSACAVTSSDPTRPASVIRATHSVPTPARELVLVGREAAYSSSASASPRRTMGGGIMPSQSGKRVTVVVADDHPLFREGVVRALVASGQVEVVAEADDGRAALADIREHAPDVALLDYKLPELDGVAVVNAVVREQLATRVLLVSAYTDSGIVYRALETGAAGFLPKEAKREEIVDGVLACARGENVVPRDIASSLVSEIRLRRNDDAPVLTAREQEILHLIAAGKSLPEIAKELYLGLTTVKTHVQHLYGKLGVSDRAAAVAVAMRRGLIE